MQGNRDFQTVSNLLRITQLENEDLKPSLFESRGWHLNASLWFLLLLWLLNSFYFSYFSQLLYLLSYVLFLLSLFLSLSHHIAFFTLSKESIIQKSFIPREPYQSQIQRRTKLLDIPVTRSWPKVTAQLLNISQTHRLPELGLSMHFVT